MPDILRGVYSIPRDDRGRRIKGAAPIPVPTEDLGPISIVVPLLADLDAEETPSPSRRPGFDPADHTVAEVLRWLAEHPDDRDRILALEEQGKARRTILHSAP